MDIKLSEEQQKFIDLALQEENILVDACIGSGKTTAIQYLCNKIPSNKKILYLTYNKLLKIDAKSKIKNKNATVSNYHGFAYLILIRNGIRVGIPDLIQAFNKNKPWVGHYDVLILDEYQDIEQELAEMLLIIKEQNPNLQIIAVGDMAQKIYDKTTLDVPSFINSFLGTYKQLEFTYCFRLSKDHAQKLGKIWNKEIHGVNENCRVETMDVPSVVKFLSEQETKDILCLGARTGLLSQVLNTLETEYPDQFNKNTVYASISDNKADGATEPTKNSAIFTTFDSSKGLERKICVVFDYTESYWDVRINKPQQSYKILRNIFCVAISRGKERIIFVNGGEAALSDETISTEASLEEKFENVDISSMFDFKYKENIENCYSLLRIKKIELKDQSEIAIKNSDGLIDLSPCIGIFQEACYFKDYKIDESIKLFFNTHKNLAFLYNEDVKMSSIEEKILFLTSLETNQERYRTQVVIPYITKQEQKAIKSRLKTHLSKNESVQVPCVIDFASKENGKILFSAQGFCDALKDDVVYELKFVSELTHEHFLQCACYVVSLGLKKGILWNVRKNAMYEIAIPNKDLFLDGVIEAITKGSIKQYYHTKEKSIWKLTQLSTLKQLGLTK